MKIKANIEMTKTEAENLLASKMLADNEDFAEVNVNIETNNRVSLSRLESLVVDLSITMGSNAKTYEKIQLIKFVRSLSGCGLKESKEFVEKYFC